MEEEQYYFEETEETFESKKSELEINIQLIEKDMERINEYFSVPFLKRRLSSNLYVEFNFPIEGKTHEFHRKVIKISSHSATAIILSESKFLSDLLVRYKKELEELQ